MSIESKLREQSSELVKSFERRKEELLSIESNIKYTLSMLEKEIESDKIRIEKEKEEIQRQNEILNRQQEYLQRKIYDLEQLVEDVNFGGIVEKAEAYKQVYLLFDSKVARYYNSIRAPKAAEAVRAYAKEIRKLRAHIAELEYQISEKWDEVEEISAEESQYYCDEEFDNSRLFLSAKEYNELSQEERWQLQLDRYLCRRHSKGWIGRMYERQIGYGYEKAGYEVEYRGIEKGVKDGGIDLICKKFDEILIVQCKCWSTDKTIYEKHIGQLYAACEYYKLSEFNEHTLFETPIKPVFISHTQLGENALNVARVLKVTIREEKLNKLYPMIKCNINSQDERIFHLPFDQQYDKTKICKPGERYVATVEEALRLGFRRARRWQGNQSENVVNTPV